MAKEEQIKTSIDLTGEKEYRAACTNINSSLREIGSEMKLSLIHISEPTRLGMISYAVFCLKKKKKQN